MEYVFTDVDEALVVMWHRMMSNDGVFERQSRNGRVRESATPVTTIFTNPRRRVLFNPVRDANPFFHLFEAIWMLAGRDDVKWLAKFNVRMLDFSDDGVSIVGSAYGLKWRRMLDDAVNMLREDRSTRRVYVPLYAEHDVGRTTKDTPCNVGVSFHVRDGRLDMTVFNRSNDMIWGAYGANVVHFSFFQEYVAALTDLEVGHYAQISSCFHLYPDFDVCKRMVGNIDPTPQFGYGQTDVSPLRILNARTEAAWQEDARIFMNDLTVRPLWEKFNPWWSDPFFRDVADPMFRAWAYWKSKSEGRTREDAYEKAMTALDKCTAPDWRRAGEEWISRRKDLRGKPVKRKDELHGYGGHA